jgi:hypothetical protein
MDPNAPPPPSRPAPSEWAVTGFLFAAVSMVLVGAFHAISGLFAIFDADFFTVPDGYFDLSVKGWGWIHLILGIVAALSGLALLTGKTWAVILAIVMAMVSAIANFLYIPIYPFWSILTIAFDIWIIWSLTRPGVSQASAR